MVRRLLLSLLLQTFIPHQAAAVQPSDEEREGKPGFVGVLRVGYSTWSDPAAADGSWSASGGLFYRVTNWLSIGPEGGYQQWNTRPDESQVGSPVSGVWNATAAVALNDFGLYRRYRLEPQFVLALGIYGRRFHDSRDGTERGGQVGPGLSLGLGLRYFPPGLRPGPGMDLGFGIIGRRHDVIMDDYGAAFAGPGHENTKTWEVAAEVLVGWE